MIYFLLVFIPPLIIATIGFLIKPKKFSNNYFLRQITWKEFLILIGISLLTCLVSMVIIFHMNVTYTEIWNGLVSKKQINKVSCRHSYSCNCVTTCSGGKHSTCTTICSTCYEHPYDFDYNVYDTAGMTYTIDTIDRQGLKIPPRWQEIQISDATSSSHYYKNYIKASKGSLFKREANYEGFRIPNYPGSIYDYYKLQRLIVNGVVVKNINRIQQKLSEMNGRLGPIKQCNIIFVLVKNQNKKFMYVLDQKWEGGNKNDIIVVISVDNQNNIEWTDVLCLSESDMFRVQLRDTIMKQKNLDMETILVETEPIVKQYFQRKSMKKFEYLKASIVPTIFQLFLVTIINSLICLVLTIYFYRENVI